MKKFQLFEDLGSAWSPIRKFQSDSLEAVKTMMSLLKAEHPDDDYVIMEIV